MKRGRAKVASLEWWQWLHFQGQHRVPGWVAGRDRLSFVGWCSDTLWAIDAKLAGKTTGKHSGPLKHPSHHWSELDTLSLFPVNLSLYLFLCPWEHLSNQRPIVITRPFCSCFLPALYINIFSIPSLHASYSSFPAIVERKTHPWSRNKTCYFKHNYISLISWGEKSIRNI